MEGHGIKILEALMLQGCVKKCGLGLGWIEHVNVPCACQLAWNNVVLVSRQSANSNSNSKSAKVCGLEMLEAHIIWRVD